MASRFTVTFRDDTVAEGLFSPRALRALSRYQAAHKDEPDANIMATLAGVHAELQSGADLEDWADSVLTYDEESVPTKAATESAELSPPSPPTSA